MEHFLLLLNNWFNGLEILIILIRVSVNYKFNLIWSCKILYPSVVLFHKRYIDKHKLGIDKLIIKLIESKKFPKLSSCLEI